MPFSKGQKVRFVGPIKGDDPYVHDWLEPYLGKIITLHKKTVFNTWDILEISLSVYEDEIRPVEKQLMLFEL